MKGTSPQRAGKVGSVSERRPTGKVPGAFAEAPAYRGLGWTGTIPVARSGSKAPLARGITGHAGTDLSDAELVAMIRRHRAANLGLRLSLTELGIDVDAYDGRAGATTLRSLEARLGPLPLTWRSTSRAPEDPVSGIYLFHAPREADWAWVTNLGEASGYRDCPAAPSVRHCAAIRAQQNRSPVLLVARGRAG